jgi:hypothetical protein
VKKLTPFIVLLSISSLAAAEVSIRVCLADGNTPLEPADANTPFVYRDIMVGTKLTIIVASDAAKTWDGVLYIEGIDRDFGVLSGRGYSATTHDWEGSRFAAAGQRARVRDALDFSSAGFNLDSHWTAVPGDWFIIDYTATQAGACRVAFYYFPPLSEWPVGLNDPLPVPHDILLAELVFNQVRTRDFDQDAAVGLGDFAVFASYWGAADCKDPDRCQGADLDADGDVDRADLALFADYWLEKTR